MASPLSLSTWQVHFHDGQMCWTERDLFNPEQKTISFTQLEGDAETFEGTWRVTEITPHSAEICFQPSFCMGIPSLADILEPIAESAIAHNINEMLVQLFTPVSEAQLA